MPMTWLLLTMAAPSVPGARREPANTPSRPWVAHCPAEPDMTTAEAAWRAARTQQLLAEGLERFEAMAKVREEAKSQPWTLLN